MRQLRKRVAPKGAYRRPLAGIYLIQHKIKRSTFASEKSNPAATPKARTFIRPLAGFLYAPAYSKGYFQPLEIFRAAESAAARFDAPGGYSRVATSKHRCPMDADNKPSASAGRKTLDDPRIHRYYVRLTSEQNERFLRMYEQSGMKNKADFICHRIFG